ncbi:MAG: hypothetical protein QOE36_467, partial [Gaiellaceae bacterium]|nr:hypothetical protein [Gaiellaceae bacterium]
QSKRVTFLTLSNHFFSAADPLPAGRGIYPMLISRADVIGFDLYPLQVWCRRDALRAVYESQLQLVGLAKGKPTFQWIEAGAMNQCGARPELDPTPATVRAETWLAIAGGARGIGFFPDWFQPPIARAVRGISDEIASLTPALLTSATPVTVAPATPLAVGARKLNGATYVIGVNPTPRATSGTIRVPGLRATSVRVYGESRTVGVRNGAFSDRFAGLALHVYIAAPRGS